MPPTPYPGAGLPLISRDLHARKLYAIGAHQDCFGSSSSLLPIREVFMMALMEALTDKPNWHEKVFDDALVAKWRKEAMEQSEDELYAKIREVPSGDLYNTRLPKPRARILSYKAFDNCIAELRSKAALCKETGLVYALDAVGNAIIKSDHTLVPEQLHQRLVDAFAELRSDQAANVDWHPRTDDKVQDLVHPSMYPFVYGRSGFLPSEEVGVQNALDYMTKGTVVPSTKKPPKDTSIFAWQMRDDGAFWSNRFQWLPANVGFHDNGTARFTSYINNLHPIKYTSIYSTIEQLVDAAIPAWNRCLKYYEAGQSRRQIACMAGCRSKPRFAKPPYSSHEDPTLWEPFNAEVLQASGFQLSEWERKSLAQRIEYQRRQPPSSEQQGAPRNTVAVVSPDDIAQEDIDEERWLCIRDPVLPEPLDFEAADHACAHDLRAKFRDAGLQVVVKMASIELTPEKPVFPAGGWHIEGQLQERIVGTALYYVDSNNVTSSHLSFRMQTGGDNSSEFDYEQDGYGFLERIYGTKLNDTAPCLQYYGDVATTPGRFLAFPNVFQHRVSGFRLQDPTKPGYRRFIALWLIDPTRRIISTANVPPQQAEWWQDAVLGGGDGVRGRLPQELAMLLAEKGVAVPPAATTAARLPAEVVNMIRKAEPAAGLMSRAEAERYRLELMDERSHHHEEAEKAFTRSTYNFCEH